MNSIKNNYFQLLQLLVYTPLFAVVPFFIVFLIRKKLNSELNINNFLVLIYSGLLSFNLAWIIEDLIRMNFQGSLLFKFFLFAFVEEFLKISVFFILLNLKKFDDQYLLIEVAASFSFIENLQHFYSTGNTDLLWIRVFPDLLHIMLAVLTLRIFQSSWSEKNKMYALLMIPILHLSYNLLVLYLTNPIFRERY